MRDILLGIYQNISSQELSIQWLTKEVLYMNQDYFGRVLFQVYETEVFFLSLKCQN